jgi:hypothetical protein
VMRGCEKRYAINHLIPQQYRCMRDGGARMLQTGSNA